MGVFYLCMDMTEANRRFGADSWQEQVLTQFVPYDAKGAHEQSSWDYTFRSEPPPILVSKNHPFG